MCTVIVSLPVLAKRLRWLAEIELTLNFGGSDGATRVELAGSRKNTVGATDEWQLSGAPQAGAGVRRGREAATDAGVVDVVVAVGVLRHELVLGA